MYCNHCGTTYGVYIIKYDTSNKPKLDNPVKINFCPVCGKKIAKGENNSEIST